MSKIPKLPGRVLTDRLTVACEPELKQELARLKKDKKIDVPTWIRQMIRENIKKVG